VTADPIPPTSVVRISLASFDPARFPEVHEMTNAISQFLIPAIEKLPGLISFYAATSPDGSMVNVSIWDSEEHAQQLDHLKEMIVDARQAAEKADATFIRPIINYPIYWTI
jgi:heme-degrading monooxygenase HmoA